MTPRTLSEAISMADEIKLIWSGVLAGGPVRTEIPISFDSGQSH